MDNNFKNYDFKKPNNFNEKTLNNFSVFHLKLIPLLIKSLTNLSQITKKTPSFRNFYKVYFIK